MFSSRNGNANRGRGPTKIPKGFDVRNVFRTPTFSSFPFNATAKFDLGPRSAEPVQSSGSYHWLPFSSSAQREPSHSTGHTPISRSATPTERAASARPPSSYDPEYERTINAKRADIPIPKPAAEYSIYPGVNKNTFIYQGSTNDTYSILSGSSSGSSSSLTAEPAFSPMTTTSTVLSQSPDVYPTELRAEPPGNLTSYHQQQPQKNHAQTDSRSFPMPPAPSSQFTSLPPASTIYTMPETNQQPSRGRETLSNTRKNSFSDIRSQRNAYHSDEEAPQRGPSRTTSQHEVDYAAACSRSHSPENSRNGRPGSAMGDSGYNSGSDSQSRRRSDYADTSRATVTRSGSGSQDANHTNIPSFNSSRPNVEHPRYGPRGRSSGGIAARMNSFSDSESTMVSSSPPPVPWASRPTSFPSTQTSTTSDSSPTVQHRQTSYEGDVTIATVLSEDPRVYHPPNKQYQTTSSYSTYDDAPPTSSRARVDSNSSPTPTGGASAQPPIPRARTPRGRSNSITNSRVQMYGEIVDDDRAPSIKVRAKSISPERRFFTDRPEKTTRGMDPAVVYNNSQNNQPTKPSISPEHRVFTDRPQTNPPRDIIQDDVRQLPAPSPSSISFPTTPHSQNVETARLDHAEDSPFLNTPARTQRVEHEVFTTQHSRSDSHFTDGPLPSVLRLPTPAPLAPYAELPPTATNSVSPEGVSAAPEPVSFRQPRVSFSEPHRRRHSAGGSKNNQRETIEPTARRHSNGEQDAPSNSSRSQPRTETRNTNKPSPIITCTRPGVRWSENLICPSPIFACDRKKGWFNSRGDQLWTNDGAYKPPQKDEEFPVEFDAYPKPGEGWMNEDGVIIDRSHRLVPKVPLRPALKRSRPSDRYVPNSQ